MNASPPDATRRLFWTFLGAHVVLWTLVPALTQANAPLDAIEMLYWGHEWQWGYYKHPPLPAWIAEASWLVFGSVDWPLYLAGQLCVAACLWAAWQMGRETLPPWPALAAAVLLETSYYFTYTTPEFNNNLPAKAGWALTTLFAWRGLVRRDWRWWAAAGAALGVALLSKYDGLLLAVAIGGFLVAHPAGRTAWKTAGPWAMLGTAAFIVAPHVAWLVAHDVHPLAYVRERAADDGSWLDRLENPLTFLVAQLPAVAGILALGATVVKSGWRPAAGDEARTVHRDYLLAAVLGPPLITALAAVVTGLEPRPMWGAAMWTHAGVLLLVTFALVEPAAPYRRLVSRTAIVGGLILLIFAARTLGHAALTGRPSRVHFPGRELAQAVTERWREVSSAPLEVVGGDWWVAGNAAFYSPDRPDVYPELNPAWAPWTGDEKLCTEGGVIVWPQGGDGFDIRVPGWLERFPGVRPLAPIELESRTLSVSKRMSFGIAIVPPAATLVR